MSRPLWSPPPGINWSLPASHIARQCKVSVKTVLAYMRLAGLPVRPRGVPKGYTWSKLKKQALDWRQRDTALAKAHGVSRQYIAQLRAQAGQPPSGSPAWRAGLG